MRITSDWFLTPRAPDASIDAATTLTLVDAGPDCAVHGLRPLRELRPVSARRMARLTRMAVVAITPLVLAGTLLLSPLSGVVGAGVAGADVPTDSGAVAAAASPTDPGASLSPDTTPVTFPDVLPTPDLGTQGIADAAEGFLLADSNISLDQVDLATGTVVGEDLSATLDDSTGGTMSLAQLAGGLAFAPAELAAEAQQATQAQQSTTAQNDPAAPTSQQSVGPDGCPTSAPPNTMRGGAPDIAKLCADSVAQARSPQAALAVKAALAHLGIPYDQPKRNQDGYYDCASFVTRMYDLAGVNLAPPGQNAPTTYVIASAAWAIHIPYSGGQPGDLAEPGPGHVTMLLADNMLVETSSKGDVSHVTSRYYTAPYMTAWIDPAKV